MIKFTVICKSKHWPSRVKKITSIIKKIFQYSFITLPKDIAKPLMYGIIIASLIDLFIPTTLSCGSP